MVHRLPPMNPLRTFVAASGFESFSKAADSLGVTQAAVSRQIGVLEAYLGVELFVRSHRKVELTQAGQAYAGLMRRAFDIIASGTEDTMFETAPETLNLRAYGTFASFWLVPRLARFRAAFPNVPVNLSTSAAPVDFQHENVDVAIQIGRPAAAGLLSEALFPVTLVPVAAPALLASGVALDAPQDLVRAPILQSVMRRGDWRAWLDKAGVQGVDLRAGLQFESSGLACHAAMAGLGVAMGHKQLIQSALEDGRLVAPFEIVLRRRYAYCMVFPERARQPRKVEAFRDWLRAEARAARGL
jgi:LysR family glycine cleavage system transcriptional activator